MKYVCCCKSSDDLSKCCCEPPSCPPLCSPPPCNPPPPTPPTCSTPPPSCPPPCCPPSCCPPKCCPSKCCPPKCCPQKCCPSPCCYPSCPPKCCPPKCCPSLCCTTPCCPPTCGEPPYCPPTCCETPCQNYLRQLACIEHKNKMCEKIKDLKKTSLIFENIMDLAKTLTQIMCICGIMGYKAEMSLDVVIYHFLNFDELVTRPGCKCRRKIRKCDFICDCKQKCKMTKCEAQLAYYITKYAFKAFYSESKPGDCCCINECEWRQAAQKMLSAFSSKGSTTPLEVQIVCRKINCTLANIIKRMKCRMCRACVNPCGPKPCPCGGPCPCPCDPCFVPCGPCPCPCPMPCDPCYDPCCDPCCIPCPDPCPDPCDDDEGKEQSGVVALEFDEDEYCSQKGSDRSLCKKDWAIIVKMTEKQTKLELTVNGIDMNFSEVQTMTLVNDEKPASDYICAAK